MAKEETYDIREAYKCTVVTFGEGVVYDCPIKKMGEQLGFFKYGLTNDKFISYVPQIQEEVSVHRDQPHVLLRISGRCMLSSGSHY